MEIGKLAVKLLVVVAVCIITSACETTKEESGGLRFVVNEQVLPADVNVIFMGFDMNGGVFNECQLKVAPKIKYVADLSEGLVRVEFGYPKDMKLHINSDYVIDSCYVENDFLEYIAHIDHVLVDGEEINLPVTSAECENKENFHIAYLFTYLMKNGNSDAKPRKFWVMQTGFRNELPHQSYSVSFLSLSRSFMNGIKSQNMALMYNDTILASPRNLEPLLKDKNITLSGLGDLIKAQKQ